MKTTMKTHDARGKHSSMKTRDLLHLAVLSLARRKTRTFLSVLGVIVGTACIVLMLSIGMNNYAQFAKMLDENTSLTEIQIHAQTEGTGSASGAGGAGGITEQQVAAMRTLAHVKGASPVLSFPCTLTTGAYQAVTNVTGIAPDVLDVPLEEGKMFPADSASPLLVLSLDGMRQFVDPSSPPDYNDWEAWEAYRPAIRWEDARIELKFGFADDAPEGGEEGNAQVPEGTAVSAQVCGVLKNDGMYSICMGFENAKRLVLENAQLAETFGVRPGSFDLAVVRVDAMENVESVMDELRAMGYDPQSETQYIEEMRAEQSRQQLQLLAIGLISLCVSAIGIANTMYAFILERRSDIGIMKVLGMPIPKIRVLFLAQAALIGAIGGLIGLGISFVIIQIMNAGISGGSFLGMYFEEGTKITIPLPVALGGVGSAVLTGILAGIWPARSAAKMSPLEAMRRGA